VDVKNVARSTAGSHGLRVFMARSDQTASGDSIAQRYRSLHTFVQSKSGVRRVAMSAGQPPRRSP
jgi:hypothetical protein